MKLTILLSSAVLFATAFSPISAYADDQNLQCRRMANGCDIRSGGGSEKISISGFDIEVKSSDRGNRTRNTVDRNTVVSTNDNIGNDDTVGAAEADHADHADNGSDVADNTPDAGNVDPGTDNTDTGASNNPSVQHNSNHIDGFDPFGGLYGPGT